MTKEEFDKLNDGDTVWFEPHYFKFPMMGFIRTIKGEKGIFINFFGDAQAHFIPRLPSFYDGVTAYENGGVPPKIKEDFGKLFAITPHKAEEGYVFVEREFEDPEGEKDTFWEKVPESEVKEGDKVIQCAIATCRQPAAQLDHCHPYEIHDTRCKDHIHTLIDDKCYNDYGILSPCCKEHQFMQKLRDDLDGRIVWLLRQNDEHSHILMPKLAETFKDVCAYIRNKWDRELLACQK